MPPELGKDFKDNQGSKGSSFETDSGIRSPGMSDSSGFEHSSGRAESLTTGSWIAGQYQIIHSLGAGGMGSVYKCMDRLTNRMVAVKVLRQELTVNSKAVQRFQREAQAIGALEHQNLVRLYNFQTDGQMPILVMEYVDGTPLNKELEDQGSLKTGRAVNIAIQICDALSYAHRVGIIHRDLKPSNIIIKQNPDGSETAKLVDFGIAKINDAQSNMTSTGEVFGSPSYMSPEQAMGQRVSESADQYALGCVLFECLTGSKPFISETPLAVMMQHMKDTPPSLKEASLGNQFPNDLELTVKRMLEKDPARRFSSMLAARDALSGKGVQAALPVDNLDKQREKSNKAISFKKLGALLGGLLALLIVAIVAGSSFLPHKEKEPLAIQQMHQSLDYSALPNTDLEPLKDTSFKQKLLAEHFWRHRTDSSVKLPDDKYPRIGSLSSKAIQTISDMKSLHDIDLAGFRDTIFLADLKNSTLNNLDLSMSDIDDSTIERLGTNLPHLQKLMLGGCKRLKAFNLKSSSIKELDLAGTSITDATLKSLARVPNLQILSVNGCRNLTNAGFNSLSKLVSLRKLNVNETAISDTSVGHLASLPNLEDLDLGEYSNLTDKCLAELAKLPHLVRLDIHGIDPKGKLHLLQKLKNLRYLGLAHSTLTAQDIDDITHLSQLKTLDVTHDNLPDEEYLRLVKSSPGLESVSRDPQAKRVREAEAILADHRFARKSPQ